MTDRFVLILVALALPVDSAVAQRSDAEALALAALQYAFGEITGPETAVLVSRQGVADSVRTVMLARALRARPIAGNEQLECNFSRPGLKCGPANAGVHLYIDELAVEGDGSVRVSVRRLTTLDRNGVKIPYAEGLTLLMVKDTLSGWRVHRVISSVVT